MALLCDPDLDGPAEPARPKGRELRFDRRTYRGDRIVSYFSNGSFALAVAMLLIGVPREIIVPVFLAGLVLGIVTATVESKLRGPYRCPQCRDVLDRLAKAEPAVHYDCPRCKIE